VKTGFRSCDGTSSSAMPNPDPTHLLDQATRLIVPLPGETVARQSDLRRAISTAYYAVFHFIVSAAADLFMTGIAARDTEQYVFVYRSVQHPWLRDLCDHLRGSLKPKSPKSPHIPSAFFGQLVQFAVNVIDLQENRHSADYDPSFPVTPDSARILVERACDTIRLFETATEQQRIAFLTLLFFDIRQSAQAPRAALP
jgi:hypothetical protein